MNKHVLKIYIVCTNLNEKSLLNRETLTDYVGLNYFEILNDVDKCSVK